MRKAKIDWLAARRDVEQAVLELAHATADFPELRLRYPKAALDDLFDADGDIKVLRSLEQYEERRPLVSVTRNKVESALFVGDVLCARSCSTWRPTTVRVSARSSKRCVDCESWRM